MIICHTSKQLRILVNPCRITFNITNDMDTFLMTEENDHNYGFLFKGSCQMTSKESLFSIAQRHVQLNSTYAHSFKIKIFDISKVTKWHWMRKWVSLDQLGLERRQDKEITWIKGVKYHSNSTVYRQIFPGLRAVYMSAINK